MTDVNRALETARALLATDPLPGAERRVHARVLARAEHARPRRVRPLVLALAAALTTSAGALALVEGPRVAKTLALLRHASSGAAQGPTATVAPMTRSGAKPLVKPATEADSAVPLPAPPSDGNVNPIPELPHVPTGTTGATASATAAPAHDAPSSLAEEVAAYGEAEALVNDSPGLAIVRLNAFRRRFPASPLAEEASLRLIQALLALGRDDEARRQARHFVAQYPASPKRAELERLANGEQ